MKIRKTERIITDTHFVCEVCEYSDTDIKKVKECERSHECEHDLYTEFDEDAQVYSTLCKECTFDHTWEDDDIISILNKEYEQKTNSKPNNIDVLNTNLSGAQIVKFDLPDHICADIVLSVIKDGDIYNLDLDIEGRTILVRRFEKLK